MRNTRNTGRCVMPRMLSCDRGKERLSKAPRSEGWFRGFHVSAVSFASLPESLFCGLRRPHVAQDGPAQGHARGITCLTAVRAPSCPLARDGPRFLAANTGSENVSGEDDDGRSGDSAI